jgi:hypothetical protein
MDLRVGSLTPLAPRSEPAFASGTTSIFLASTRLPQLLIVKDQTFPEFLSNLRQFWPKKFFILPLSDSPDFLSTLNSPFAQKGDRSWENTFLAFC